MSNFPVIDGAKVIVELNQAGKPLKVYVARKADGSPLQDLTDSGKDQPSHQVNDNMRIATVEFYGGNCINIGGRWFCA
jgi:hypothetical protein